MTRTLPELRAAVACLLADPANADLSDREIARQAGCNKVVVRRLRDRLSVSGHLPPESHSRTRPYKPNAKLRGLGRSFL